MDDNIVCVVCEGTNFFKESGFYFCSECQTQSQEIQEHAFDDFDAKLAKKATKLDSKSSKKLTQAQLTTWECYNYVLKGLTDELIALGAEMLLSPVVKKLWMKYLLKIEVLNLDKPKLQAVNTKVDAEIIYGKKSKRKRKARGSKSSNTSDTDLSSLTSTSLKRERKRRSNALIKAQYNHSMTLSGDASLNNETLTSLKSSSGQSSVSSVPLQYNKHAKRELRKRQSKKHLMEHTVDFENDMRCHRNSYTEASMTYKRKPHCLSINKIYSILYLGLLLTKSQIQLGDMLRFIREGHLSFNSFKHFFPEELSNNYLTQNIPRKLSLVSKKVRESTFQLAKYLGVLKYIGVQNLPMLIERYCKELNLPSMIEERVLKLLLISSPEMYFNGRSGVLPNYEGRALSLILFQLKLLFGLDGKSEIYFSKFARAVNESNSVSEDMFDVLVWMQYLDYRSSVIKKTHFPTEFSLCKQMKSSRNISKFLAFKNTEYDKYDPSKKYNKAIDDCLQLLTKLKNEQEALEEPLYFLPSLNPFSEYVKIILSFQHVSDVEKQILNNSFDTSSIDFITNAQKYFSYAKSHDDVEIRKGGANTNLKLKELNNSGSKVKQINESKEFKIIRIKNNNHDENNDSKPIATSSGSHGQVQDCIDKFTQIHNFDDRGKLKEENSESLVYSNIHFKPFETHWINCDFYLGSLSKIDFEEHSRTYPYTFQFLLKEMARIAEQEVQDILCEYNLTELYLLYEQTFADCENANINYFSNKTMKNLVKRAKKHW